MKTPSLIAGIFSFIFFSGSMPVLSQVGDQVLDGIGETALIARYIFKGDARDWSRNNFHAGIKGTDFRFEEDALFGNVLSLQGGNEAYVSIPGEALAGQESVTITGWLYLRSAKAGQLFFDSVKDSSTHFLAAPAGLTGPPGFEARLHTRYGKRVAVSGPVDINKWTHIAVVINASAGTLSTCLNGVPSGETQCTVADIQSIFGKDQGEEISFFVGRSLAPGNPNLNARLHDFRIYSVPLSAAQISLIYQNALKKETPSVRTRKETEPGLPKFPASTPQLYNAWLASVPDIALETEVGRLPRLPRHLRGVYKNNGEGPPVRVIWPAPADNSQVLAPGVFTVTGIVPGTDIRPKATVRVSEAGAYSPPAKSLETFGLDRVTLNKDSHGNSTKFIENRDKFMAGLARTNPDNFLYMFRNAFGREQPEGAEPLGGWDSQQTKLRGHATGHYLSAIAQAYAGAGYDPSLRDALAVKMDYMVKVLYDLSQLSGKPETAGGDHVADPAAVPPGPGRQDYNSDLSREGIRTDYRNWGRGFISAYPPDQFIMLEKGASYGGDSTKIWAPYYTLHKIFAGLLDVYECSGNEKALEIVKGMGDWVYARLKNLPVSTRLSMWNRYIAGEYGGMNEVMARLYRLTDEPRYLETAHLFDNIRVFFGDEAHSHGLAKNVDLFRGLHANQHIPQVIGAIETYRVSGDPGYYSIADNFWHIVTDDYMYSIGGVAGASNPANAECFTAQPASLYENGFSAGGQNETCATYNMLKLTGSLFLFNQDAGLMDYYERALYNHILASVAEDSPANTYHVPLRPGSVKQFGNANMKGFSCCNGTALESNTKLQNSIYFRSPDNKALYVNLYVPSTLNWTERNVTVVQSTAYPREDHTLLTINGKGRFDLIVRVPNWATNGFFVKVNGKAEKFNPVPGSYLTISRKWKNGDTVELIMPFHFYLEPVMDQQNIASLFYGPVLLAAQESEPLKEWRKISLNASDISKSISGDPGKLEFNIDGIVFRPFFETYGRHSVYLDVTLKQDLEQGIGLNKTEAVNY